jgi:hypothetical protein
MSIVPAEHIDRLLDPVVKCLTPDGAERLLELELDATVRQRLDELVAKANEGTLSDAEQTEYDSYVNVIDVIGMLQAKAGAALDQSPPTTTKG